jgi:alkylation response protein AidB-like acyl-CoA dehydrogenase
VDFSLTEEQIMLKDSVSRFLADNYSHEQRRALIQEPALAKKNWAQFADLGWLSIPFSEEQGGFGGNIVDLATVMEEFGKTLVVEPFWSTVVLAGQLIARGSNLVVQQNLLPKIIAGQSQVSFAWQEHNGGAALNYVSTEANKNGSSYLLSGEKTLVMNAAADVFLISARSSGNVDDTAGIDLFQVSASHPKLQRETVRLMDGHSAVNLRFQELELSEADRISDAGNAYGLINDVVNEALVALSAEAIGAMEYLYKATAEYANTRQQFGVAIGKFQALQHRMVDMFMATEQCRSLLVRAQCSLLDKSPAAEQDIAALKSMVGKYGRKVAEEAVQLHGGMGVTNEMPIGDYMKRLMMIDSYFGNAALHRRRFCELRYAS